MLNLEMCLCFLMCICWNRSADKQPPAIARSMDRSDELGKMKPGILYSPHSNLCCLMLLGVGWLERQSLHDENSVRFSYVLLLSVAYLILLPVFAWSLMIWSTCCSCQLKSSFVEPALELLNSNSRSSFFPILLIIFFI